MGIKKSSKIVAVGGGITQDISGFISSIIYRGIDWVFFPTTLLAQADSCIGSKTSINFDGATQATRRVRSKHFEPTPGNVWYSQRTSSI